jgi:hypothetical protein
VINNFYEIDFNFNPDEFLQFPTFGKKELNWETDIELKSKQIDREVNFKFFCNF